ncbi:MAG: J domain-containing protein, partial [Spirochaetia bacterium]
MRELYRVLEVEPTADFETIRESYRRLLKRYHPDSGGAQDHPRCASSGTNPASSSKTRARAILARARVLDEEAGL